MSRGVLAPLRSRIRGVQTLSDQLPNTSRRSVLDAALRFRSNAIHAHRVYRQTSGHGPADHYVRSFYMTLAASRAQRLAKAIASNNCVFTFLDDGHFIIYPTIDGDVIPLWESDVACKKLVMNIPKYSKYQISKIEGKELADLFTRIGKDGIKVGANWYGKGLTGYNYPVAELIKMIDYHKGRT